MFVHKNGIKAPSEISIQDKHWSKAYIHWLNILADSFEGGNSLRLRTLIDSLFTSKKYLKELEKQMYLTSSKMHPVMYELIQTVPGIGKLSAAKICLEIMNFNRFPEDRHLAGFIGLVPDCKASDKKEIILGASERRNKILRYTLIECSWMSLSKDPALGSYYSKAVTKGKKPML